MAKKYGVFNKTAACTLDDAEFQTGFTCLVAVKQLADTV